MNLRPAWVAALVLGAIGSAAAQAPSNQVLPGSKSGQPIDIDAGKLDYFDKEQKLIYTGNVVAVQGGSRLKSSVLTIYLLPKDENDTSGPSSDTEVRRMEAAGPVTLTSKDQVGTGDSGVYEKGSNKVTLTGNVTLTQGPNVTKGDLLIYDLSTKQAVVRGNVRSMFLPKNGSAAAVGDGASSASATPAAKTAPRSPAKSADRRSKDAH